MALLSPLQNIGALNGVTPSYAAATATTGDTLAGGQGVFIHVKNANAGSVNVVITTPESVDGDLDVEDRTVAVAAGAEVMLPVPSRYNNPSTGLATVVCTPAASVTIGAFRGPVQQ
jgi:hypothetical protein